MCPFRISPSTSKASRFPGVDKYVLARGNVSYARNADKSAALKPPIVNESPAGNSIKAFSLVHIDWLTGRARLEKQEFP